MFFLVTLPTPQEWKQPLSRDILSSTFSYPLFLSFLALLLRSKHWIFFLNEANFEVILMRGIENRFTLLWNRNITNCSGSLELWKIHIKLSRWRRGISEYGSNVASGLFDFESISRGKLSSGSCSRCCASCRWRRSCLRCSRQLSSFPSELVVEICQLPQESVVGAHIPVTANFREGLDSSHVLPQHEVGQDAGRGARHTHEAVDQNFAWKKWAGILHLPDDRWKLWMKHLPPLFNASSINSATSWKYIAMFVWATSRSLSPLYLMPKGL